MKSYAVLHVATSQGYQDGTNLTAKFREPSAVAFTAAGTCRLLLCYPACLLHTPSPHNDLYPDPVLPTSDPTTTMPFCPYI